MSHYSPDVEGYVLCLRRPLMALAGIKMPPPPDPFDVEVEVALQADVLETALARIPSSYLDNLRAGALKASKVLADPDMRRAQKRSAAIMFDHMVSRGLKPAGSKRSPEPADYEQLALRACVYTLIATIVPDEELIRANQEATEAWMALPDPEDAPRDQAVLGYMFRAESQIYMEAMDNNGTTERFLAKQQGRMN